MTRDIYIVKNIVKIRTNKHKQTDVLLYVYVGCGLNNCYYVDAKQSALEIGTSLFVFFFFVFFFFLHGSHK